MLILLDKYKSYLIFTLQNIILSYVHVGLFYQFAPVISKLYQYIWYNTYLKTLFLSPSKGGEDIPSVCPS